MEDDRSRDGASSSSFMRNRLGGAFVPYTTPQSSSDGTSLRSAHMRLVARLTKDIVETFQNCNINFMYSKDQNPKRYLTNPSTGMLNDGFDNVNSDLILHVNLELVNMQSNQRYIVKEILGQGTFGQVAKCWILETNSYVAVKIIKNQPAYHHQALVEVHILKTLNEKFDPDDKHHIVRIYDWFVHREHLCIAFEMLDMNLYELMRKNQFKGFSLNVVQVFSKQILHALVIMKDAGIIHCDLKPENILVSTSLRLGEIKVIDFGSACRESETVYSYIQSRYYRSPEVVLGYQYTTAIDMWSLGCIVAELFLGLPLFPGASEFDLLKRMIEILGAQPPDDLLRYSKNTSKFFKHIGSIYQLEDDEVLKGITSAYRVLTEDEYEAKESRRPPIGKNYFSSLELESIIKSYPYRKNLAEKEITKERETRLALIDLLRGLLEFDPVKRWSPFQASRHPFVTGEPFICPYKPPPETPRIPVSRTVIVDHNPGGGHWVAAGISPQVSNVNRCLPHNTPRFQMVPLSHGGSLGSFGSYNDNAGLGSSYGSYGDMGNMYPYYSSVGPSGMNMPAHVGPSILGASPDARRRLQLSHGNGYGVSPTGNMQPMSLGASPSQFTPPSSQMQYGPVSPARGSIHGSPLGKATSSQYSRRRNWASPGQQYESASHHRHSHHSDGMSCSQRDSYSRGHVGSPRSTLPVSSTSNWRQQLVSGNELSSTSTTGNHQNFSLSHAPNLNMASSHFQEGPYGKTECSLSVPDPADWDPDYREDLLFQVDTSEARSNTSGVSNCAVHGTTSERATLASGVGRLSLGNNPTHQKTDALFQAYSSADGSPPSAHDIRAGCSPLSHFAQTSTSRFRKQSVRENNMRTSSMRGEQSHQKGQPVYSNYNMGDTRSANMMFGNGMSWGGRSGHPVATTTLPASHGRKKL